MHRRRLGSSQRELTSVARVVDTIVVDTIVVDMVVAPQPATAGTFLPVPHDSVVDSTIHERALFFILPWRSIAAAAAVDTRGGEASFPRCLESLLVAAATALTAVDAASLSPLFAPIGRLHCHRRRRRYGRRVLPFPFLIAVAFP